MPYSWKEEDYLKQEHYDYIKEKYGDLFYTISNHISGDFAISKEDTVQALWVAVYDAIDGFERQNNGSNGKVDDFIKSRAFGKYLKTVLWNYKNKIGASIKDKYAFQKDSFRIGSAHSGTDRDANVHTPEIQDKSAEWVCSGELTFNDLKGSLSEIERKVVNAILDNPCTMLSDGKINLKAISRECGLSTYKIGKAYSSLKGKLQSVQ